MLADYVSFALLLRALFIALRRASASLASIAATLEVIAVATHLATNTSFEMLSASSQYAAATTDANRSIREQCRSDLR